MRRINIYVMATLFLGLSGCAVMSVEECQHANWAEIGEYDGASGLYGRIAEYEKACAKGNIQPHSALYQLGYQKGRQQFCQPEVIFQKSLKGLGNYEICPVELRDQLEPYHTVARNYYHAQQQKEALFDDLERYQGYLLDQKLSKERREEYRNKVRELRIKQERIDFNYFEAERQLTRFKREKGL